MKTSKQLIYFHINYILLLYTVRILIGPILLLVFLYVYFVYLPFKFCINCIIYYKCVFGLGLDFLRPFLIVVLPIQDSRWRIEIKSLNIILIWNMNKKKFFNVFWYRGCNLQITG